MVFCRVPSPEQQGRVRGRRGVPPRETGLTLMPKSKIQITPVASQYRLWNLPSTAKPPFSSRVTLADQRLVSWYSPCMSSRCVEVTSVAKVNKKLLVTRFCIAMRAPGSELLPPNVGSIDKLERPASFCTPPLT